MLSCSDVETDDSIHTTRGCSFITHIMRLSGRQGAEQAPKCPQNGLRNAGTGTGVASLMSREWCQSVGFCLGVCLLMSFELTTHIKERGISIFLLSWPKIKQVGKRGWERWNTVSKHPQWSPSLYYNLSMMVK